MDGLRERVVKIKPVFGFRSTRDRTKVMVRRLKHAGQLRGKRIRRKCRNGQSSRYQDTHRSFSLSDSERMGDCFQIVNPNLINRESSIPNRWSGRYTSIVL